MNCCVTVLLRYYGNATGCIGHVTKENPICHNIFDRNVCDSVYGMLSVKLEAADSLTRTIK
jgi:hypothetical protein